MFDTYIEDKAMIPVLLGYDWMIWKDTWTDCPYETYMFLKKKVIHNGNAVPLEQHTGTSCTYTEPYTSAFTDSIV